MPGEDTERGYREAPDTDGWIEGYEPSHEGISPTVGALIKRADGRLSDEERAQRARSMAILAHMSVLFGFPIFLFMLFKRDDPFVLHHAKAAGGAFISFYGLLLAAIVWHPILIWAVLLAYLFPLVAIWRASKGHRAGWLGLGVMGEVMFFPVQISHEATRRRLLRGREES